MTGTRSDRVRGLVRFVGASVVLALAAGSLPAVSADPAAGGLSADRVAAIRRAALATYFHGMTEDIALKEVGREGVPVLRELLRDPSFERRDNVVAFLAFLGDAAEADALVALLANPPASPAMPAEDRSLLVAPQALGQIAARSHRAAMVELMKMTTHGSGGGVLVQAAAHAARPDAMRDDLLEAAMRGLAYAGGAEAEARLQALAKGETVPVRGGRDLRRAARQALELFAELQGAPPVASATDAGADGSPQAATTWPGTLDTWTTAHQTGLTYANHPAVSSPMTDARLDEVLRLASLRAGTGDFADDVACCTSFTRSGTAATFGSLGDGLDTIDTSTEMSQVLSNTAARFKVVRAITYCGGTGTNIIGCAWLPGNGGAVVRMTDLAKEAVLWLHEYGHNVGLSHNSAGSAWVMYGVDYGTNNGINATECGRYHQPASTTGMTPVAIGACTDQDLDMVQDAADNCPGTENHDQADADKDGIGDLCDTGTLPACGNGIRESGEACDGTQLGATTCQSLGFSAGTLSCRADCTYDSSRCTRCGDGVRSGIEACDGTDLGGATCQSLGFYAGTLSCKSDCTYNSSLCPRCGDGVRNGSEACDGSDLGGATCQSLGFATGTLTCSASCTLNQSGCSSTTTTTCLDSDGDGITRCAGDCNDADPRIYPGAREIGCDGIDQDCNGRDKLTGCKTRR